MVVEMVVVEMVETAVLLLVMMVGLVREGEGMKGMGIAVVLMIVEKWSALSLWMCRRGYC